MAKKTITETREEPGMSNAGKYPNVSKDDFCGPKGTYPVNTIERGRSALKLAHNAGSKRKAKKIKEAVQSPLFHAAVAGSIGLVLFVEAHQLYAGMGFGLAACKFLDAFK